MMIDQLKTHQVSLIVMEATGQYQLACACALQAAGFAVVVINPRQARDFAKATGRLVKTDSVDACVLAELAQVLNLRPDRDRFMKPMSDQAQQYLHALVLRRRQLVRLLHSERQRKHMAWAAAGFNDTLARCKIRPGGGSWREEAHSPTRSCAPRSAAPAAPSTWR